MNRSTPNTPRLGLAGRTAALFQSAQITPLLALVALLLGLHGLREYVLDDGTDAQLLQMLAFVPGRFTYSYDPGGVADLFASFTGPLGRAQEQSAKFYAANILLALEGLHANGIIYRE